MKIFEDIREFFSWVILLTVIAPLIPLLCVVARLWNLFWYREVKQDWEIYLPTAKKRMGRAYSILADLCSK